LRLPGYRPVFKDKPLSHRALFPSVDESRI
jgi:hypothetical protein